MQLKVSANYFVVRTDLFLEVRGPPHRMHLRNEFQFAFVLRGAKVNAVTLLTAPK